MKDITNTITSATVAPPGYRFLTAGERVPEGALWRIDANCRWQECNSSVWTVLTPLHALTDFCIRLSVPQSDALAWSKLPQHIATVLAKRRPAKAKWCPLGIDERIKVGDQVWSRQCHAWVSVKKGTEYVGSTPRKESRHFRRKDQA